MRIPSAHGGFQGRRIDCQRGQGGLLLKDPFFLAVGLFVSPDRLLPRGSSPLYVGEASLWSVWVELCLWRLVAPGWASQTAPGWFEPPALRFTRPAPKPLLPYPITFWILQTFYQTLSFFKLSRSRKNLTYIQEVSFAFRLVTGRVLILSKSSTAWNALSRLGAGAGLSVTGPLVECDERLFMVLNVKLCLVFMETFGIITACGEEHVLLANGSWKFKCPKEAEYPNGSPVVVFSECILLLDLGMINTD